MIRFEIEDIISQDKQGIIYRAYDHEAKSVVALRRFSPFGHNGGGLAKDEAASYCAASKLLSSLKHPSFRSVISGHVDPIDGLPYIVAEWIPGHSVGELAGSQKVDAGFVIDILHQAIEVSIALSSILGEEAIWVDTATECILVGTKDSGRHIVFWLSPYKWLSCEQNSRKVASLIELTENLLCWRGKIIGSQACFGLGGWIKQLRANPDTSPSHMLSTLKPIMALKNGSSVEKLRSLTTSTISTNNTIPEKKPEYNISYLETKKTKLIRNPLLLLLCIAPPTIGLMCIAYFYLPSKIDGKPNLKENTKSKKIILNPNDTLTLSKIGRGEEIEIEGC